MLKDFLGNMSQASYVEYGYGQVEPNHLSAQKTGQIYAQLPAAADIEVLEQGQFAKYDYAKGVVNFETEGTGEWMLVFNEIKLYREGQVDCEFAMTKGNYMARIYSPGGQPTTFGQSRYYGGKDAEGNTIEKVTAPASKYEIHATEDPFLIEIGANKPTKMVDGTTMVPRLLKTNVGDIFTTNMVNATELNVGDVLTPGAKGILEVGEGDMQWQVVKVYTMPDRQKGVKIMRIA